MDLATSLRFLKGVGEKKYQLLKRLGLEHIADLLTYYPRRYEDRSVRKLIIEAEVGEVVTVCASILHLVEKRTPRMKILVATLSDDSGSLEAVWFNQPFLKKQLKVGKKILLTGKVEAAYGKWHVKTIKNINSFIIIDESEDLADYLRLVPIYPLTDNLSQNFFTRLFTEVFSSLKTLEEVIPAYIIEKNALVSRYDAFHMVHFPQNLEDIERGRKRLIFEELYLIQCGLLLLKKNISEDNKGLLHLMSSMLVKNALASLPFSLTKAQARVWHEIEKDMERDIPMRRLLQGDVGSGKTAIAFLALMKTVENGYQGAFLAPTEILARQHAEKFAKLLVDKKIHLALLTGKSTSKEKQSIKEKLKKHEIDIIIGTHALLEDDVSFHLLGLIVTDEQHRFGIKQRAKLEQNKAYLPDVLVMTATPIPRTMTLTVYGDLDVSFMDELPPKRRQIRSFIRSKIARSKVYAFVKKEILAGRQAYVVAPLIEKNEQIPFPSVEELYKELTEGIFADISVAILHGKMKAQEKEKIMEKFYRGEISLLVSTTVIEVGIDVPNANVMVIEGAERFGLAQLHQLRGRVGRGEHASYCICITQDDKNSTENERLQKFVSIANGFKLAEEDLKLRGPGEFFGSMQHGMGDLKIANVLRDTDILFQARRAALETLEKEENISYIRNILERKYHGSFFAITNT